MTDPIANAPQPDKRRPAPARPAEELFGWVVPVGGFLVPVAAAGAAAAGAPRLLHVQAGPDAPGAAMGPTGHGSADVMDGGWRLVGGSGVAVTPVTPLAAAAGMPRAEGMALPVTGAPGLVAMAPRPFMSPTPPPPGGDAGQGSAAATSPSQILHAGGGPTPVPHAPPVLTPHVAPTLAPMATPGLVPPLAGNLAPPLLHTILQPAIQNGGMSAQLVPPGGTQGLPLLAVASNGGPAVAALATLGLEDQVTPLRIAAADIHGATDSLRVLVSGLPAGASLTAGAALPDGSWQVSGHDLATLGLRPGPDWSGQGVLQVTVIQPDGQQAMAPLPFRIDPVADAALISGNDQGQVREDVLTSASGQLQVIDPDAGEQHFVAAAQSGALGRLTIGEDGAWSYALDNADPAVQRLTSTGATLVERFVVHSADGTAHAIEITIGGQDDAAIITGAAVGAVREDDQLQTGGKLSVTDPDAGQAEFVPQSQAAGAHGVFTVAADGTWSYALDNANPAIQALKTGDQLTDTVQVSTLDGTTQRITVTISGRDDAAQITGTAVGAVGEDDQLQTGGKLSVTDPDAGQAAFVPQSQAAGAHGVFTVAADGTWSYALDNANPAIQALKAGDQLTDTLTVSTLDGTTQRITVTISGTNDAAVITGTDSLTLTEDQGVRGDRNLSATGRLAVTDVDAGEARFNVQAGAGDHGHGNFVVASTGAWVFTVDNDSPAIQALKAGEHITESFTAHSLDGTAHTISVTIAGTDDRAVIAGTAVGSVTEDAGVTAAGKLTSSGTLTVADPDAGQAQFVAQTDTAGGNGHGTFSIDAQGHWTYTADNSQAAIQSLNVGQRITDTLTVHTADGTVQTLTVTITGTNDAPVIGAATSAAAAAQSGPPLEITTGNALQQLITAMGDCNSNFYAYQPGYGGVMAAGAFYQYALDKNGMKDPLDEVFIDADPAGMQDYLSKHLFTERGIVLRGPAGTPDQVIPGSLDDPAHAGRLTMGELIAWELKGPDYSVQFLRPVSGWSRFFLSDTDQWDAGVSSGAAQLSAAGQATLDSLRIDGQHPFTFVPRAPAGPAPEVTTGEVQEDVVTQVSGTLHAHDVDAGDTVTFAVKGNAHGTFGDFSVDARSGEWHYTLNSGAQALKTGDTRQEQFTLLITDTHGGTVEQVMTMTVKGTDDRAVIAGDLSGAVTEDRVLSTGGTLTVSDADSADHPGFVVHDAANPLHGAYGSLTLDAQGNWHYTLDDSLPAVQKLGPGTPVTDLITVEATDGSTQQIRIAIAGTNDAPTITAAAMLMPTQVDTARTYPIKYLLDRADDIDDGRDSLHLQNLHCDPTQGTVALSADGRSFTFTPAHGFTGMADIHYEVIDPHGATVAGTAQLGVGAVPSYTAINAAAQVRGVVDLGSSGNTIPLVISGTTLMSTTVDPDQDPLHIFNVTVDHGTVTGPDLAGNYLYTPQPGYTGAVAFHYEVTDSARPTGLQVQAATAQLTLTQPNAVISGTDTGTLTEDSAVTAGMITTSGTLTVTDADAGQAHFVAQANAAGTYGSFTLTADGHWTYSANDSQAAVQALKAGATLTDTLTVTSADGTAHTVTVTITGTNDAPTVAHALATMTTAEDAAFSFAVPRGSFADIDTGDTLTLSTGTLPSWLHFDAATGTFSGTPANGDVGTTQVTVTATDGSGARISTTFDLVVSNTNDAPTLNAISTVHTTEDGTRVTGQLHAVDPDAGDRLTYSTTAQVAGFTLNADGSYSFDPTHADYQHLAAGQTLPISIPVTVTDAAGAHATQTLSLTLTGTDDAPTIGLSATGTAAGVADASHQISTGQHAEDLMAALRAIADTVSFSSNTGDDYDTLGKLGQLAVETFSRLDDSLFERFLSSIEQYALVTNAQIVLTDPSGTETIVPLTNGVAGMTFREIGDFLKQGPDYHLHFLVDAGKPLQVAIADTPDAGADLNFDAYQSGLAHRVPDVMQYSPAALKPSGSFALGPRTIAAPPEVTSGEVMEDSAPTLSGTLHASDIDDKDALTFSVQGGGHGAYGDLTIDPSTGDWHYTLNAKAQALGAGEAKPEVFTLVVTDKSGATVQQDLTLTVKGSNDVAVIAGTDSGSVTEDNPGTASGKVSISDVDTLDKPAFVTADAAHPIQGTYGSLTLDAAGNWIYTLDSSKAAVQALNADHPATDHITVRGVDGATHTISITITGTDDAPVMTQVAHLKTTPADGARTYPISYLSFYATDVDDKTNQLHVQNIQVDPAQGSVVVNADGTFTFTAAHGYTGVAELHYEVVDAHGGVTAATTQLGVGAGLNSVINTSPTSSRDVDLGATPNGMPLVISPAEFLKTTVDPDQDPLTVRGLSVDHGSISGPDAAGNYLYTPEAGYHGPVQFKYNVTDNPSEPHFGVDVKAQLQLLDANAQIGGADSATTPDDDTAVSGQLTITDPDRGQDHFQGITANGQYGSFALTSNGAWDYTPDNRADALNPGETRQEVFTVHAADGTVHTVTVTLTGSAEPTITGTPSVTGNAVIGGVDTATTPDDDTAVSGQLTVTDPDANSDFFQGAAARGQYGSFVLNSGGAWNYVPDDRADALNTGQTAQDLFTVHSADGTPHTVAITITGSPEAQVGHAAGVQPGAGTDGTGIATSNPQLQALVFQGTQVGGGTAIIGVDSGSVIEDVQVHDFGTAGAFLTANGQLTALAADGSKLGFQGATLLGQGNLGQLRIAADGAWSYQIDDRQAGVQELRDGETRDERFTVTAADGTTHQVVIHLTGTQDAPAITGVSAASTPDDDTGVQGRLTIADPDRAQSGFVAQSDADGQYGKFSITADGRWSYTPDGRADAIPQGQSQQEAFTVTSADGTTHTVTVTVAGSNEGAVISGTDAGTVTEDTNMTGGRGGNTIHASGKLQITDVDQGEATFPMQMGNSANGYGSFVIAPNGSWTYTAHDDQAAIQQLAEGQTLTDSFTVHSADGTQHTITVTITGTNDAPTVTAEDTAHAADLGATAEDTPKTFTEAQLLQLVGASDVDHDSLSISAVTVDAQYGAFARQPDGSWRFTPAANAHHDDIPLTLTVNDGHSTTQAHATLDLTPVTDQATASLSLTARQEIIGTGSSAAPGRIVVDNLQAAHALTEATFEFTVIGQAAGASGGVTGPVILNFGSSSDANMLTLWNPANMKIGGAGDAATGINLADGQSHRVTLTWTSASGELKVFDNGQLVRTATGYHQGGTLPADGFMVLGQKMNHPGNAADPGWNANEHYEGSIFNAAIASKALSPTEVASAPLASVLDKQSGLLVDVRSIGGQLTDTTGTHSLVRDGGLTFSTGQVDLAFAPAPPGALLHLHATLGAPGDATDHVVSAMLGGLPHGTVVSDGTHSATVGASTPEVDVHAWALGSLTAQLPVGFHSNARISLEVITQGPDGAQAHMATSQPLVMDPLHPIPDATFSGADQAITDENSAVSGVLTVTDPTAADAHVLAGTEHGNLGSLDIAADGHWAYTPDGRAGALHAGDVGHENFAVHSADGSLHHIAVDVTGADQPPPPPMPAPAADDTVPAAEAITLQADHAGPAHALPGDPAPSLDHSGADQSGGVDPYLLAVGVQATVPESVHATLDGALAGGVDPSQLPVPDLDPALLGAATGEGGLDHVFADPPPVAADHAMPIEAAALPVPDTEPQHH